MPKSSNIVRVIMGTVIALQLSGCVSASRHKKTEQELAEAQARVNDLQAKLGNTGAAKTKLESSMVDMKQALEDLRKRKLETDKRIAEFRELTEKFRSLVDSGKLSVHIVQGRMVVALSTDVLFPSGSARLSADGAKAIAEVSELLVSLQDKKFQIEGHTDNVRIHTAQFPSNWELAAARALTVVKTMLDAGMPPERISAASYSQYQPIAANDTSEGKSANRRIEIAIVPDLSSLPGFDELSQMSGGQAAPSKAAGSGTPSPGEATPGSRSPVTPTIPPRDTVPAAPGASQ